MNLALSEWPVRFWWLQGAGKPRFFGTFMREILARFRQCKKSQKIK
jgi:hypothetical protein